MSQVQPNDDVVREQAYYLWEAEGKPHGREHEFWQRAAVALSGKSKMSTLAKPAPKKVKDEAPKASKVAAGKTKAAANKSKAPPAKTVPAKKPKKK
ncbi:MAG: DUF2934 domain-containing protein [Devosia sp.]